MENVVASPATFETAEHNPRTWVWTGRVLTGLIVAFLVFDTVGKLIPLPEFVEGTKKAGYRVELLRPLGLLLGIPTLLHLLPRTQFVGALLLTAYFGGAVATHVLGGTSSWFPIVFCVVLWVGYCLRSPRLRSFLRATLQ
jgi:DoxX-like family